MRHHGCPLRCDDSSGGLSKSLHPGESQIICRTTHARVSRFDSKRSMARSRRPTERSGVAWSKGHCCEFALTDPSHLLTKFLAGPAQAIDQLARSPAHMEGQGFALPRPPLTAIATEPLVRMRRRQGAAGDSCMQVQRQDSHRTDHKAYCRLLAAIMPRRR